MNPPTDPVAAPFILAPPGAWLWDHWERFALENGLAVELATLGRAVMRAKRDGQRAREAAEHQPGEF